MSETIEPGSHEAAPAELVIPAGEGHSPAPADITADTAAADTADDPGAEQSKTPDWLQKRIDKAVAKQRAAERQAEELAQTSRMLAEQLTRLQQQPQEQAKPAASQLPPDLVQAIGSAPRPQDFPAGEFDPAYIEERALHRFRTEQAQQIVRARQTQQQQAQQQFAQKLNTIIDEGRTKHPDFDDAVNAIQALHVPGLGDVVRREIADCDSPAEVAYYLGKNPEAAARIAQAKSPTAVARELAKIEARIASAPPPPQPSNAPPPPRPVRGTAASRVDPSRMSIEEYARWRNGE